MRRSAKWAAVVLGAAAIIASAPSHAQLGGLTGVFSGSKSGSSESITSDTIVKRYVAGSQDVMTADVHLLNALGLKDQAAKEELAAKNLTEGATADGLEDAAAVQTESSKALAEKLNEKQVKLDAKSKKTYTKGLVYLAKGVSEYRSLSTDVSGYRPGITSFGTTANSAMYITKALPTSSKNLYDTLKNAVNFARNNHIEVPREATSLL